MHSKQKALAVYMYRRFIEYGDFYKKENIVFNDFYLENKLIIDGLINNLFKSKDTERIVDHARRIKDAEEERKRLLTWTPPRFGEH